MTPEKITLVQQSFKQVAPISDQAAVIFYEKLFELDPKIKPLFSSADMKVQGSKLMSMLGAAVSGLTNLENLLPTIKSLGVRHVEYGVTDAHYDTVGEALMFTLEKGLGDAFTEEVAEAWLTTYTVVSNTMKEAASSVIAA